MAVASAHPTPEQLNALIQGVLSDQDNQRFTGHLEACETCQEKLQTIATGEIPVDSLVQGLKELDPSDKSALWHAMEKVDQDVRKAIAVSQADTAAGISPGSTNTSSVSVPQPVVAQRPADLDFLEPSDDPAYVGKLHHFQIARVIGRGGMGIVLEAFDTHLQRAVAVKVLTPQFQSNEIARQRFCREGRAAAAISHEHVVPMYQVARAKEGEVAYLVMQLIEGYTLESRLEDGRPLAPKEVARIAMQVAAGLSAAHKRGMVHRDIKPANIMIETETNRVKITDFGLARTTDDVKLTKTGMVTGTPLYMSPEQTLGETADEQSDLFSLGAVLYEMATGVAPFQAPSAIGVMQRIMNESPQPPHQVNAAIPRPLSDLIVSLLAKQPEDRPESAADLAKALAAIVNEFGPISPLQVPAVAANEVKKLSGSHRRTQRRWAFASWMVGLVGVAAAVVAFLFVPGKDTGDSFPSVVLANNPGTVWSVDFAPDGKTLAAAVEDGSVRVFDIQTQTLLKSFNAHRGIVWMVEYHPDRPLVVTSGDDSDIKLWDSQTFELLSTWEAENAVRGVAFSPDGTRLAAGDREGNLFIFDLSTGERIASKTHAGSSLGIDYSADGKFIASVGSDKTLRIFDAESLEERHSLSGHDGPIYNVSFSPVGNRVATVGWNKNVRIWDTETGSEVTSLSGSDGDVWGVAFCGDGSHLVASDQTGAARVWDLQSGLPIATLRGHASAVHNVSLDQATRRIATSSRDGTIRVWDMSQLTD
ncbi:MAG: serine/threonine-protein kinase [Planctomycetota bacterium]